MVLPLARPALVVTALFSFMTAWNEFILAATFLSDERVFTLPVVLQLLPTGLGLVAVAPPAPDASRRWPSSWSRPLLRLVDDALLLPGMVMDSRPSPCNGMDPVCWWPAAYGGVRGTSHGQ